MSTSTTRPTAPEPVAPAPTTPDAWRDLLDGWGDIRNGYYLGEADEAVLQCVHHLDADPTGPDALLWTLGLVTLVPYVAAAAPGPGVEARTAEVLSVVARAHGDRICKHEKHPFEPYEDDLDTQLEALPSAFSALISQEAEAPDAYAPGHWHCPRNIAGFARAALSYLTV
ncbi:hypothetical protein ACH4GK_30860 [Streptomyces rimosus]|uniref:hypothetical protein n=1 Tax=Streptomyces rimosus TaxID=1927 RepID=UPI00067D065C|nr:hypothetical protein [Streptomyces rimosus]